MAVEAQLCPQCGATLQFAENQTEVVCSYCGATVDKAQVQEILHVNDVGELSPADRDKLHNLILDGRRQDALYFIRRYTGLGEDQMYFVLRGKDLAAVAEALDVVVGANMALRDYAKGRREALSTI